MLNEQYDDLSRRVDVMQKDQADQARKEREGVELIFQATLEAGTKPPKEGACGSEAHGCLKLEFARPDGIRLTTYLRDGTARDHAQWPPSPLGVSDHFRVHDLRAQNDAERQIFALWLTQTERIAKDLRLS